MFDRNQIKYMKSIGLKCDFNNLSDSDYIKIEETVGSRLQYAGIDENYNVTEEGLICESILDAID